jgi:hypothetical protein
MMLARIGKTAIAVSAAVTFAFLAMSIGPTKAHAQQQQDSDQYLASIGLQIAPSFINAAGKDMTLVGLGSFIANAQADCNGCHGSDPANEFVPATNPYLLGTSKNPLFITAITAAPQFNQATYLNGGQNFGPVGPGVVSDPTSPLFAGPGAGPAIITRNLTPDYTGNPAGGIDLPTFINILRTGHDYDSLHPNCGTFETDLGTFVTYTDNCYNAPVNGTVLQVMPWVKFRNMTDYQLTALWTYLSTVPCNAHNDALGTMFPWLQNSCTAPVKKSFRASSSSDAAARVEPHRQVRH